MDVCVCVCVSVGGVFLANRSQDLFKPLALCLNVTLPDKGMTDHKNLYHEKEYGFQRQLGVPDKFLIAE